MKFIKIKGKIKSERKDNTEKIKKKISTHGS